MEIILSIFSEQKKYKCDSKIFIFIPLFKDHSFVEVGINAKTNPRRKVFGSTGDRKTLESIFSRCFLGYICKQTHYIGINTFKV